ncbi:hypothetical protein K438DRAFT_1967648 [Mycena galopus ATCC 62051]|nr:hypothetical protein K438DRAFT_1967648 [Mycena galopus ATCC 62051]
MAAGEGSHTLSWIWYTVGEEEGNKDPRLQDALRVEWCKVLARKRRYDEEVRLLREEMRHTVAYREAVACEWECLAAEELPGAPPELMEGRCAYAAEHAATERACCKYLERRWHGILAKADIYLGGARYRRRRRRLQKQ